MKSTISTGTVITTIQAPARNLVASRTAAATAVRTAPVALTAVRGTQPSGRYVAQCFASPIWLIVSREHTDRIQRDQSLSVTVHRDQQCQGRHGQHHDPEAVHRRLRAQGEPMWQSVVLDQQAHQDRQTTEGGIRRKASTRATTVLMASYTQPVPKAPAVS